MKRIRKALALVLAFCMLFTLVACGGEKTPETTAAETTAAPETQAPETTAAPAESTEAQAEVDPMDYAAANIDWKQYAGTELRVVFNEHFFADGIKALLPEFEELTGIKVNLETYPESDFYNKLLIEFNGGSTPPDCFMLDYATAVQYQAGGWVEDLTPYVNNPALTDAEWYDYNDLMASALELGRVGDDPAQYGLPVTGEWEILFYRKDLYEKYNLQIPTTFDELVANATLINEKEEGVSGYVARCARNSAAFWPWGGFLRTYNGLWLDAEGVPQLDSAETSAATEMYAKLLREAGPQGVVNYTWYECLTDFQQGKTAHFIDSSGFMANMENTESSTVAGNVGYALLPAATAGGTSVPCLANWMVGMSKGSQNKEAAYLFLEWATCKKVGLQIAISNGTAARSSLWSDERFTSSYPQQWVEVSLKSSENASKSCLNLHTEVWELGEALEIAINEMYSGTDTATAMAACQASSMEIMGLD